MERFVETVTVTNPDTGAKTPRKANFKGQWGGLWWQPPDLEITDGDAIWIVEGCLDAIALNLNGVKAVASLSAQHYPDKALDRLKGKKHTLVWALDNDAAGKKWIQRHVARSCKDGFMACAAYIPSRESASGKVDWNDVHIQGRLNAKFLDLCRWHGDLLTARHHREKALLIHKRHGSTFFCYEFSNRMYGFELSMETLNKALKDDEIVTDELREAAVSQVCEIHEIANFAVEFQYFKRNEITDESWYSAQIRFPHKGGAVRCDFTGAQISTAPEFKKRAMSVAPGAVFTGRATHLDWLAKHHLYAIKTVQTIDFIGYSKEHQAYIFDKLAFCKGQQYSINPQEYFEFGKTSVTTLQKSVTLDIAEAADYRPDWIEHYWGAFGEKGIVALAYWFGTLFAEQIRSHHSSYPFLEIVGEAGSGKTSLIEFLWKLLGRADEEGFDPAKATAAAAARKFAQVSNLPIVLIEADRDADTARARKFDWEETKPLYNGRGSRSRGVKNSGNETYDPPFRGALVVAQNEAVNASPAVMQRFLHIEFTRGQHSEDSKRAADALNLTRVQDVSHFIARALLHEQEIVGNFLKDFHSYENALLSEPEIKTIRIAKNHAQLFAIVEALFPLIKLNAAQQAAVRQHIREMAIERQKAIGGDHPVVEAFWEIVDYLENTTPEGGVVDHSRRKDVIAINLNHFVHLASEHRQQIPAMDELKKHLKNGSKSRPLLHINHPVNSRVPTNSATDSSGSTRRCWIFKNPSSGIPAHG